MQASYWTKVLQRRLTRRRALAAAGAGAAGAVIFSACGGGDEGPSQPEDKSGLLFTLSDETKKGIKGGTYKYVHPLVIITHDPMFPGGQIRVARRGYSQLFRIKEGVLKQSDGEIEGDFAESWEITPDKLTITAKIDPGVGLPPIPPVNGRTMDTDDVLFSWERVKAKGVNRAELANAANAEAPILSITAPDKKTLVIKLKEPNVTTMALLGSDVLGGLYIIPKEGDTQFDVVRTAIGSGPFYMTQSNDAGYRWKRNPNFKRVSLKSGEPFFDEIDEPLLTDPAAQSSQFRTGNIYEMAGIQVTDIVKTKKDVPDLVMRPTQPGTFNTRIFFGQNPDSPFKDERLRIAFMKCIDRDGLLATNFNTDNFAKEGLPVQAYWEGPVRSATYTGWWLDPKGKDFGENAKNFVFSREEAKKLVEAAGYKTPFEITMPYAQQGPISFPFFYYTAAEVWTAMIESSSDVFKLTRKPLNYASEWTPQIRQTKSKFTGVSWGPDTAPAEAVAAAFYNYNSTGGSYFMGGDSTLDDMTRKARAEFDDKKRVSIIHELQRYEAGKMYNELTANAGGFNLAWPALRNILVYRGGTNWMDGAGNTGLKAFIDPSLPPIKKA